MPYQAPVKDIRFILDNVVGFDRVAATERFIEATPELTDAILTEAGRMCDDILAPLQRPGDEHPARLENGAVHTSPGFGAGYQAIAQGGWIGMASAPEYGGMGLPTSLSMAVNDMMSGACLSLQLNPLMTQGQIEALEHHADDAMKSLYLPKLISGEWCGTMNLTEPQAGSDLAALRSKAEPNGDGTFAVSGQKIFISWADNDFTSNVCHLVLARLPDAPAGTKGISLFLVPKLIPDADGNPGEVNSLRIVSLEHKMGLHGSPTAVMEFDQARGWLVGNEHAGLAAMFTMMNNARLGVGVQGVGVAEAATQQALAYAAERKQGKASGSGAIIEHADVRRMLACMKAETFAARSIAMACAVAIDMSTATEDSQWKARAALLTPIAKAFGTDVGIDVSSIGLQVHGGMGYIEETGAAQFSRDVRVTAIYEGTNGIQAMDLVGRKLMDKGAAAFALLEDIRERADAAKATLPDLAEATWQASESLGEATEWLIERDQSERNAVAVPFLKAFARILGADAHLAAAMSGEIARVKLAQFYIKRLLPEHVSLLAHVKEGATDLMALTPDELRA